MNALTVKTLLDQWYELLITGKLASIAKAKSQIEGIDGRIRRTRGQPVIFDFGFYDDQLEIQEELCRQLPEWADLIRSQPEIMDGFPWTRKDFIELYFRHFTLVIEKLKRITAEIAIV